MSVVVQIAHYVSVSTYILSGHIVLGELQHSSSGEQGDTRGHRHIKTDGVARKIIHRSVTTTGKQNAIKQ